MPGNPKILEDHRAAENLRDLVPRSVTTGMSPFLRLGLSTPDLSPAPLAHVSLNRVTTYLTNPNTWGDHVECDNDFKPAERATKAPGLPGSAQGCP